MCGLVGVLGKINKPEREAFKFMLLVDQIRGFHSTGVCTVGKNGSQSTLKKALHSTDFLDLKTAGSLIDNNNNCILMGHNRWATVGAVNSTNAHPFTHGKITGMHNGTLRKQSLLDDHKDFEVDSESIIHCINKNGVDNTVGKLHGAYALTFHDSIENKLHMVRNNERPLFYTYSKDKSTMLWASEKWMILVAANKSNIKVGQVQELPIHKILTVDMKGFNEYKDKLSNRVSIKAVEPYVVPITNASKSKSCYAGNPKLPKILRFVFHTVVKPCTTGHKKTYEGISELGYDVDTTTYTETSRLELDTVYEAPIRSVTSVKGVPSYTVDPWDCKEVLDESVGKTLRGLA